MVIGYGRIGVHCYQPVSWKGWSKKERRTKDPVPEWCVALPLERKRKYSKKASQWEGRTSSIASVSKNVRMSAGGI